MPTVSHPLNVKDTKHTVLDRISDRSSVHPAVAEIEPVSAFPCLQRVDHEEVGRFKPVQNARGVAGCIATDNSRDCGSGDKVLVDLLSRRK